MLAHERLRIVEGAREHVDVVAGADVGQHEGRVALEPTELRALRRRLAARAAEILLRHPEDVPRNRTQLRESLGAPDVTLTPEDLARIERAVPMGAASGSRYDAGQMAMLDSER